MDVFGIYWMYEPKVYRLPSGGYLPDFYLPHADCFLEVKGAFPTEDEIRKARELEDHTGRPVFFAHGRPIQEGKRLIHGVITWINGSKRLEYSVFEICEGLERCGKIDQMIRFIHAGKLKPAPDVRHVSDILDEWFWSHADRQTTEEWQADQCGKANAEKSGAAPGQADEFIKKMADKCAEIRSRT